MFVDERDAIRAVKGGDASPPIKAGDVIVLIGNGPSGTGMQETAQITTALKYLPWGKHVALLTDGRFSGISTGACIGHVGPEALQGGPIGRVRDDDIIEIVIDRRALTGSIDLVGADGERTRRATLRRRCSRRAARVQRLRRTPRCPTTRGSGPRCSARAAARGAAASTTSIESSRRSTRASRHWRRSQMTHATDSHDERRRCSTRTASFYPLADDWDALINHADLAELSSHASRRARPASRGSTARVLAPIGSQEVWAAGVTYYRSRTARIEESKDAGGGSFYDRVYDAERPELFFKAASWRVRGPGRAGSNSSRREVERARAGARALHQCARARSSATRSATT